MHLYKIIWHLKNILTLNSPRYQHNLEKKSILEFIYEEFYSLNQVLTKLKKNSISGHGHKSYRAHTNQDSIAKARLSRYHAGSAQRRANGRLYFALPRLVVDSSPRRAVLHDLLVQLRDVEEPHDQASTKVDAQQSGDVLLRCHGRLGGRARHVSSRRRQNVSTNSARWERRARVAATHIPHHQGD